MCPECADRTVEGKGEKKYIEKPIRPADPCRNAEQRKGLAGLDQDSQRERAMNHDERELIKHDLEGTAAFGPTEPPPFADAPDMAETLRLLQKVSRMPDIRFEKVQQMRELIAQNQFETPERVDGTVRRLMEELGLLP